MPGISAVSPPTSAQPASSAARGDAGDHRRAPAPTSQLAGGEIVEEEQRLGALHHQVVDAHRDQVDADGVVQAGLDRELQLGADAVGGGDQDRVGEAGRLQVEQRAEAAQAAQHAGPRGGARQRLDRLDQRIAGIDIDAGRAIGQAIALGWRPAAAADPALAHAAALDTLSRAESVGGRDGTMARPSAQPGGDVAAGARRPEATRAHAGRHPCRPRARRRAAHAAQRHHLRAGSASCRWRSGASSTHCSL